MNLNLPGIQRRALLIRAGGAEAYVLRSGGVSLEAAFTLGELELFHGYCQSRRSSLFAIVADLVEEDFQFETIPYVIGPTRSQLLTRKFEQLYRNMPYRACASIGRETGAAGNARRRDEQPAHTRVAGLGDGAAALRIAGAVLAGHDHRRQYVDAFCCERIRRDQERGKTG